ncbi:tyrosine-type recombinase/integrase [Alistipes indistinctus]|uniref:tyrosine-type recombinase/integrase n=1 Tax=Alistipes indistinctus TaxID=626932 RepID=UPI00241EA453|nr:site-specific integrase [Alistipes indistinctus]
MNKKKTFQDVSKIWCDAKRPIVKHSTMCAYLLTLQTHLLPWFGTMETIAECDVQQFVIDKCASGLARKTVRDMVAVLKSIVKYGNKHGIFHFEEWEIEYPTDTENKLLPTLSLNHQRILMNHLIEQPTQQNIGVLLALCTGMRIGEVCALQWEDVDFTQRIITVRHTVGRIYNCELKTTERIHTSPKTKNSCREIPISKQLFQSLKTVRKQSQSPYVVGISTQSKEPRSYRDYFSRLLKRLNIPHLVFHGLRHTFATRCIESQCDYKTVSVILGHSNVATTLNLYVHPNLSQKKKCIDRMSKFLGMA